jgi:hypothetical protein
MQKPLGNLPATIGSGGFHVEDKKRFMTRRKLSGNLWQLFDRSYKMQRQELMRLLESAWEGGVVEAPIYPCRN